jgi:addiction module HigA family antidote
MAKSLGEIHPGEVLSDDFMKPMGITASKLAVDLDVPESQISVLLQGARPISLDIALRLGHLFKMDPGFWVNLQTEYDMRVAATR